MTRKFLVFFAVLLMIAAISACGAKENRNADGADKGNNNTGVAAAETIYKKNCVTCHGTDLEGRMGANSNLTQVGAKLSKEQIANQIANGGNGMVAFKGKLSEEEINTLADWLAAKK